MGKNAPAQRSKSGVNETTNNHKLKIVNLKWLACFLPMVFVFAQISLAQAIPQMDLESLALKINKGSAEQKRDALFQIRNLRSAEVSRIALSALKDSSEIVRASAASAVIFLPPDEAVQNLAPLLSDKKELVRREAAYALGEIHSLLAVQPLIRAIQTEKIGDVKNACVVALGASGDSSAIVFLTGILQKPARKDDDADEFLRRAAARSIGQIAQDLQIGKLEVLTPQSLLISGKTDSPKIALPAYKNLPANFPDFRQSVTVLTQILRNSGEADDTKREAAFALGAIGDASAIPVLQNNINAADYYLAQICKESIAKIFSVPASENMPLR